MDPDGPPPLVRAALDGAGPPGGLAAWCCATGLVAVGGAPTAGGVEVALLDPQRPQAHTTLRLAGGPPSPLVALDWAPPGAGVALLAATAAGSVAAWSPACGPTATGPAATPLDVGAWGGRLVLETGGDAVVCARWLEPPASVAWPPAPAAATPGLEQRFRAAARLPTPAAACHWAGPGALVGLVVTAGAKAHFFWAAPGGGWAAAAAADVGAVPLAAADAAIGADGGLRLLTLPASGWPATVARLGGDPTAVDDGGCALDTLGPPAPLTTALAPPGGGGPVGVAFLAASAGEAVLLVARDADGSGVVVARHDEAAAWGAAASWRLPLADYPHLPRPIMLSQSPCGSLALLASPSGGAWALCPAPGAPPPARLAPAATAGAAGPTGACAAVVKRAPGGGCEVGVVVVGGGDAAWGSAGDRLAWAIARGLAPWDAAAAAAAGPRPALAAALASLAADVASAPWVVRPSLYGPACRAALAAVRCASAAAAWGASEGGAAPTTSTPEQVLEQDLNMALRAWELEWAASQLVTVSVGAAGAGAKPRACLPPDAAAALAPWLAWMEALALRTVQVGRAWAAEREAADGNGDAAAAAAADGAPGVRLLTSTTFLAALRQALGAASMAPTGTGGGLAALGRAYAVWEAAGPLPARLRALSAGLQAIQEANEASAAEAGMSPPTPAQVDVPGATASILEAAAASFAGDFRMPYCRALGPLHARTLAAVFEKACGPGGGAALLPPADPPPPPPPLPVAPAAAVAVAPRARRPVALGPVGSGDAGGGALARLPDAQAVATAARKRARWEAGRDEAAACGVEPTWLPGVDTLTGVPAAAAPLPAYVSAGGATATALGGSQSAPAAALLGAAWLAACPVTGGRWYAAD